RFEVPPVSPNSFFDVFFDVCQANLPDLPLKFAPGSQSSQVAAATKFPSAVASTCTADPHNDGNVDITWKEGSTVTGDVHKHIASLLVCPGHGFSLIGLEVGCLSSTEPWAVTVACPGFSATLVN